MKIAKVDRLKVVSYNIHKGFSSGNRRFVLAQMKEALRKIGPDILFLQEVLGHHEIHGQKIPGKSNLVQFEYLADEHWPYCAYGKNAVYSAGHHGNAILSKYPFQFFENINISTNALEKRGLLHGKIEVPGTHHGVHLICLHLGLMEAGRTEQVQMLCDRIESHVPHHEPLIIAGDFNDWRQRVSKPLKEQLGVSEAFLTLHGAHARTFPSWLPALRLDRVYSRGLTLESARCLAGKPWDSLSDHLALMTELVF